MEDVTSCSKCKTVLGENDRFCSTCGYPEKGSPEEIKKYLYSIKIKTDVVEEAKSKLKNVKQVLYFIIVVNIIAGTYYLTVDATFYDGIGGLIAALIYTGCLIWVNKQPLMGILAAFIFWIALQLLVVLVDPAAIFSGLLLKVVFVVVFIKGISSARDIKKYTHQLKELKSV